MHNYNFAWQPTETQFLEALLLATGGEGAAPLQEVLLMADAIDGTVFTLKEVEQALEKLVAAQVITIQKNKLAIVAAFLQRYEAATLEQELTENNSVLLKLLEQQTISEEIIKTAREGELKKYKLKTHYQAYQEQFGG